MDKRLKDILEEEEMQVNELAELVRRTELAESKLQKLYALFEEGEDCVLPIIERTMEDVDTMKEMQSEYTEKLNNIRKQILVCVRDILDTRCFKYLPAKKRKQVTVEEARELIKNRKRATKGGTIRKGGRRYVKINKIQN